MSTPELGFIHRFIPSSTGEIVNSPTLLLLHGTGGNETDLLDIAQKIAPLANVLSPRGKILENGMPRFFRRLAEGVFDEQDLTFRTHELADFILAAGKHYGFQGSEIVAVGYSNGANIAASTLLLRPGILQGAILLRAMVPLEPEMKPDLSKSKVFLASGIHDPILPLENARRLAGMIQQAGAHLEANEFDTGHQLTKDDMRMAKEWMDRHFSR